MRIRITVLAVATLLALAPSGPARAILLTLDPAAQTVNVSDAIAVNLNISGLGDFAAPSLGAWDVDIGFDTAVLGFTGATFGNQLDLFGFGSITGVFDLGGVVDLFEISFDFSSDLDTLQAGAFTLATLTFDALAAGTSALSLTIDALSDSLGGPLAATASGASVTVNGVVAVPEPATWAMFLLGLAVLVSLRRHSRA